MNHNGMLLIMRTDSRNVVSARARMFSRFIALATRALRTALVLVIVTLAAPNIVRAQNAIFSGTVLIDPSEKPLANAEIVIVSLNRSVRTDSAGNFTMTGLPAGRYSVQVRMVGYETFTSELVLKDLQTVEADLLLKATTQTLAPVSVKEAANPNSLHLKEFDERRRSSTGRFITSDVFQREDGRPVSAIITKEIGGVKIIQSNGRRFLTSGRQGDVRLGGRVTGRSPGTETSSIDVPNACYMAVIVDGVVRYNGSPGQPFFDVDQLDAKDIVGFEMHNTATVPAQFNGTVAPGTASCGVAIIWTKRG
jgi:hypothetical protein